MDLYELHFVLLETCFLFGQACCLGDYDMMYCSVPGTLIDYALIKRCFENDYLLRRSCYVFFRHLHIIKYIGALVIACEEM